MSLKTLILRRDSEASWNANNPILNYGEPGLVYVTENDDSLFRLKIGNGTDTWKDLPYFGEEYVRDLGSFSSSGGGESAAASANIISDPRIAFILYKINDKDGNVAIEQRIDGKTNSTYTTTQFILLAGNRYRRKITYSKNSSGTVENISVGGWTKVSDNNGVLYSSGSEVVTVGRDQTISGVKNFSSNHKINNKTIISSNIDPGELKVLHDVEEKRNKGFIIRTSKDSTAAILPLEILTTNGSASYKYSFPSVSGNIPVGAKVNGKTYTPDLTNGLIDFGDELTTRSIRINGNVISNNNGEFNLGAGFVKSKDITYSDLKELKNNKQLVPGQQYRIIDYVTTTKQEDTISDGKPFDILVTAISNDSLSENAIACHPKGSRAFYGSSQIGFPLKANESITPLSWTELESIPEYFIDHIAQYENENNISFGEYSLVRDGFSVTITGGAVKIIIGQGGSTISSTCLGVELFSGETLITADYTLKTLNPSDTSINYLLTGFDLNKTYQVKLLFIKSIGVSGSLNLRVEIDDFSKPYYSDINMSKWEIKYDVENNTDKYLWADEENGKGVIYYLKDEWNNECWYDFKNIKFKRTKAWVEENDLREPNDELKFTEDEKYFYTFDWNGSDDSLCRGTYKCENNSIGRLMSKNQIQLNNTIFLGNGNANNIIGENNKNNVIGVDSYNNTIGVNFQNNKLPTKFAYNTIGNGFKNNSYKNKFQYNNIGHLFDSNVFNSYVTDNIIGNYFRNNTIGNYVINNTINSHFENNTITQYFYYNNVGVYVDHLNVDGFVGHSVLGNKLQYVTNFPSLYKVSINPYTLVGTSENIIDLNSINISDSETLSNALQNTKTSGGWAEESLVLYKNDLGNYQLYKNSDFLTYIDESINGVVGNAPDKLNTLEDIASALENNENIIQDLRGAIGDKLDKSEIKTINGTSLIGTGNIAIDPPGFIKGDGENNAILNGSLNCSATGDYSIAGGEYADATGEASVALGRGCEASGRGAIALGGVLEVFYVTGKAGATTYTTTSYINEYFVGSDIRVREDYSNKIATILSVSGSQFTVDRTLSEDTDLENHAFSIIGCNAQGVSSVALGLSFKSIGTSSNSEGRLTVAAGISSHAEGTKTVAAGDYSHSEGMQTIARGKGSHVEGNYTTANGLLSHAEGAGGLNIYFTGNNKIYTIESGSNIQNSFSFVKGIVGKSIINSNNNARIATILSSDIADDGYTVSITLDTDLGELKKAKYAILFGGAYGNYSHSENVSLANGDASHSQGDVSIANGDGSFVHGLNSVADGETSAVFGTNNYVQNNSEFTIGISNHSHTGETSEEQTLFSIGCGDWQTITMETRIANQIPLPTPEDGKNAIEIMRNGDVWLGDYGDGVKLYDRESNKLNLADVATTGSYNDLTDTPTIPTQVTESTINSWGFTKNKGTITEIKVNDSIKNQDSNGVVDLGTVITEVKTINGESILGSGNISIKGKELDKHFINSLGDQTLRFRGFIVPNNLTVVETEITVSTPHNIWYNSDTNKFVATSGERFFDFDGFIDGSDHNKYTIFPSPSTLPNLPIYFSGTYGFCRVDENTSPYKTLYTNDTTLGNYKFEQNSTDLNIYRHKYTNNFYVWSREEVDGQRQLEVTNSLIHSYNFRVSDYLTSESYNYNSEIVQNFLNLNDNSVWIWENNSLTSKPIDAGILDNSITTNKVADKAITQDKLSEEIQNKLSNVLTHDDIYDEGLVLNTDLKTINGNSIIGGGDLKVGIKEIVEFSGNEIILSPNKYYRCIDSNPESIKITFSSENPSILQEFFVEFTTSANGTTVELPNTIKWVNGEIPIFYDGFTYQISVVNNLGVCTKFS